MSDNGDWVNTGSFWKPNWEYIPYDGPDTNTEEEPGVIHHPPRTPDEIDREHGPEQELWPDAADEFDRARFGGGGGSSGQVKIGGFTCYQWLIILGIIAVLFLLIILIFVASTGPHL